MSKNYRLLPYLSGLFVATLIISNTIVGKLFNLGPLTLSAATLIFPLAYIFSDILTEVYGYATTRKLIWTGFAGQMLMVVFYQITVALPASPSTLHPEAYGYIFNQVPRFVAASITAYFFGEFLNSFVLAKMKVASAGKWIAWRFVLSTVVGQAVDSFVVIILMFAGTMPWPVMLQIIISVWIVKVLWEIIALPATLPIVKVIKKYENEDYFDRHTDFNPLKLD